jgi:ketosteroid isomerase-like protein
MRRSVPVLLAIAAGFAIPAVTAVTLATADESPEVPVLAAQETWRKAMLTKDAAAFDKVFHPQLSYGHSIGLIENKQQATDHVLKSTTIYKAVEITETKVKLYGDTAVLTGKMHYEKHPKGAPVLHQHLVVLSVWVKTPRGWQMIARQSTEPNPARPVAQSK